MKALSDIILPADLKYTDEHIWAKVDGAEIILGVSDFAQDQLGEIVFVDLPAVGDTFKAGAGFGTVESIKSVNTLYMPVNGAVVAVNTELDGVPTIVNADCYSKGWMIRIKADNQADLNALLSTDAYRKVLEA